MDKIIASILILSLVVFLFLSVIQNNISTAIEQKSIEVENIINPKE